MQDVPSLCDSTMNCLAPFKELLQRINARDDVPPVTCILSDGLMTFTLDAAEEIGVPNVIFWTTSACGFLSYLYFDNIVQKGLSPIKDESCLDTEIDWIPTMKNLRLKDIPSFIRATTRDDIMLNFLLREVDRVKRASAIILNTYDDLERDTIQAIQSITPPVYSIGPLHLLVDRDIDNDSEIGRMGSNLWREDTTSVDWLDTKPRNSVVYVNFGSITVMSAKHLVEFAWGLAATGKDFLWVIRPDLVAGELAVVPTEFLTETADRRMIVSWCPQERVLSHPAVGGFLTHSGWNSTLESLCRGVPMVCWPFFAEQQTNCKFCRDEWEVGMEIGGDVRREEVDAVVRELMDGEKGKKMREKAEKWRCLAEGATEPKRGSSELNFQMFVDKVLLGRG